MLRFPESKHIYKIDVAAAQNYIARRKFGFKLHSFSLGWRCRPQLGPIIGGGFTDHVTWRWCFYVNLPIGGFTLLTVLFFLDIKSAKRDKLTFIAQIRQMDPLGMFFFAPSMVCLILTLQWGGSNYPWSAPRIIGLLVTFAVLFIAFVVVEVLLPETAMTPTRVVLNRSVAGSMVFMLLLSGGLMSIVYYLTIWFQAVKDDSAERAGLSIIPLLLSLIIMNALSSLFTQKIGHYVPALLLSPVLCSVGTGLLSTLTPSSGHNHWIGYQVLYGLGIGCGMQAANLPVQNVLPRSDVPLGMGLMFFMQQIGGSVFLAVSQNIFSSTLVDTLSGFAGLNTEAIINTGATALRNSVPPDQLASVVAAYSHALTRVFILATALSACMSLGALSVQWIKIQGKKPARGPSKTPSTETEESKGDGLH